MVTEKYCFYCNKKYNEKDSEHVFPDGLGGEKIYMDCVCINCNNEFSSLERELYQKSIVGLIRNVKKVSGAKTKNKTSYLKANLLVVFDEKNKIVYEVNQNEKFEITLKPQIIEINSKLYLECNPGYNPQTFLSKLRNWKKDSLVLALESNNSIIYIQFKIVNNKITSKELTLNTKLKNHLILDILDTHELSEYLTPRIFLDNENNLRIRSKSVETAKTFVKNLLLYTIAPVTFKSFSKTIDFNDTVYSGFIFNSLKTEQAMVKIMLNCLLYYFPKTKNHESLKSSKDFVKGLPNRLSRQLVQKNSLIDSEENTHNVFFYQIRNCLIVRLSLFNGSLCYEIYIDSLNILPASSYRKLTVNYKQRNNTFINPK